MRLAATMTSGLAVLAWAAGCSPTVDGFPVGLTPGPGVVRGFALEQGISPNWEASGPADRAQFGAQLVHIEGTGLAVLDVSTRPELTVLGKKAPSRAACAREIEELAWIASVGDEDGDGRADAVLGFWEGDAAQVVSGASLCDEEGPTVIGGWTWADVPRTLRAAHPFVNEAGGGWLLDVSAKPSSSEEQPDGLPGGVLVTGGYGALDSPVEFTCPEGTAYAGLLPAVRSDGLALMNCFVSGGGGSVLMALSPSAGRFVFRITSPQRVHTRGGFLAPAEGQEEGIALRSDGTTVFFPASAVGAADGELMIEDGVVGDYGAPVHSQAFVEVDGVPLVVTTLDGALRLHGLDTSGSGGEVLYELPALDGADRANSTLAWWSERRELVLASPYHGGE